LVGRQGTVEQESGGHRADALPVSLDGPAAQTRDEVKRTGAARSAPGTPRHLRPVPVSRSAVTILRAFLPHHVALPPGIYTARGANWAARGRPVSRRRGVCITDRPNDPGAGSCRGSWERPLEVDDGTVRIGRARGVRRARSAPLAGARAALRRVF